MNFFTSLWSFFASVKLALYTLCLLATTSIIGTIIPQGNPHSFYIQKYGQKTALLFEVLNITDMYNAWWFIALLGVLSVNLIVCSCDRFPAVLRQIRLDNLAMPLSRIEKMKLSRQWSAATPPQQATPGLQASLQKAGWKTTSRSVENGTLLFSQKNAWSRTGVYIVHVSILVIFIGAIIGDRQGFKGSVYILEGEKTPTIISTQTGKKLDLGFEVQCDSFNIDFYRNGMAKEYRSLLRVFENNQQVAVKEIEVNKPLQHRGITFYQSSYQPYNDFVVSVKKTDEERPHTFIVPYQEQQIIPGHNILFRILEAKVMRDRVTRMKIWFYDNEGEPSMFWMNAGNQVTIERPEARYHFMAKQRYATGLQVAKDPGVWLVYIGCGLMLFGLYVAFFLSHRRIWVYINNDKTPLVRITGTTNKDKMNFEKVFSALAKNLETSSQEKTA